MPVTARCMKALKREIIMKKTVLFLSILICLVTADSVVADAFLDRFKKDVHRFTLDNGMTFLVVSRNHAPVVSFVTLVDTGSVDEPAGHTGIAHFLEHMAFKGTPRIGTRNWDKEKQVLKKLEQAYRELIAARYKSDRDARPDIDTLRREFEHLREQAEQYVDPNAYARLLQQNGATDLNAATGSDYTMYFCSLPATKAELWFQLESDRLANPVFRQFYKEKQVVLEERRMRVDSDPTGRLFEEFLATAFMAHPYGEPVIGWASDIITTTRTDMAHFYNRHYFPANMTVAVVGDVTPDLVRSLADTHFSAMETKERDMEFITREPEQNSVRTITHKGPNQPVYVEGYHTVDSVHKDAPALDLLADILARGRLSRLYRQLVVQKGLAHAIHVSGGFPGDKYPGLLMFYAIPRQNTSLDRLSDALHDELLKITRDKVTFKELERAKTRRRADLIRSLKTNLGLAITLATADVEPGGWRRMFTFLEKLQQVTAEEVRTAARTYLRSDNRTIGRLELQETSKGEK